VSESARALCQIIERRPFLTLTDREVELLATALSEQAVSSNLPSRSLGQEFAELAHKAWGELKARRLDLASKMTAERALREGTWPSPERCDSFTISRLMNTPIQCQDKQGHDGKHYNGPKYARQEWE